MNTEINMNQVNIVVAELNRLFNSSTGAGPKNLYLELDKERMANLELISYSPVVDINPIEFARFLAEWDALDIVKELRGKDYLTQCEILVPVALKSQETLGMSVIVNAAALRPGQKVVRETFWHGLCYTPDGVAHTPESYYLSEKPVRIHGPCELRPSLIEAMEEGLIDSNFELPDLTKPMGNHKQALLDILTPEQRALAEELIKSRGMSKEVDYSDCRSEEDIKAKFAGTFGLNPQQVTDATGPIGFITDVDFATFQGSLINQGYWNGFRIPESIEDLEAPEGYTHVIKTGKEHNLHPELKVKTSDTCEEIRKAMGKNHHSDYWSTVVRLANGLEIVLPLSDKKFGMAANSVEKATSLLLSLNDADLEVYREKVGLTIEEMKFSLKLLKHKAIKVIDANRPLHDDKSLYLLDIFDISAMSEYEMRKIQLLMDTHRGPEYQIEQMELNVAAHKQYMSELYRLMYHANEMPLEKRLDSLFLLITHANNFSNDQMVHFHIGLGEGLIGEFEAPVDHDSWQTLLRLFEHAKVAVETSQDVTELAGVSFNLRYLGEEPSDAGECVDIFLEHQHDAFFVIPLELWNGK